VFAVRYEVRFAFQKTAFFVVTAVKTSNITKKKHRLNRRNKGCKLKLN
jgi:hypothetical protein